MVEGKTIRFVLNGTEVTVQVRPGRTLLHLLREELDLTGTKQGCDCEGECGACTVLLDGQAVRACLTPVEKVAGRRVVTIEGLAADGRLHPLQQAFIDYGAVQCGYCTPGMLLSAAALLAREPEPDREQIVEALAGNLCRCTGYHKIIQAVQAAAAVMRGDTAPVPAYAGQGRVIGGDPVRVDAVEKVTGAARYAEDIKMAGLLHAVVVRSPHAHARIAAVDGTTARRLPGVVRVVTAADIPGLNSLEGYSRDEPLLSPPGGQVRMVGDPLAIVLGESPEQARAGAAAVNVEYDPLPPVYDAPTAMAPGAASLYAGGNVLNEYQILYGDMEAAMAEADVVLESHYRTPFMEHAALERETVLAYRDGEGRVVVVAGHQEPHWAHGWIARLLDLPWEGVRVIVPPTGGAFGGKQDPWPLMAGALAAYHAPGGRPVRLAYTRRESFDASPKRHPYEIDYRIGARQDGRLTGLHLRFVANTGAYDADGYYIPPYGLVAGGGAYRWQAADARAWSVYTNNPKAGQMRGFGTPQSTFALECTLDELAERLGLDPLEFRLRNAIEDGTVTFLGYPPAETVGYRQCLEAVRPGYRAALDSASAFNQAHRSGPWRRGVGLAGMWYRFGKSGSMACEADAELGLDGRITCFCSAPDYGQGTTTVMAQLAAEALGLPRDCLAVVNADTGLTPDSGIQGASRSTYWVGGAVVRAATVLKDQMLNTAAEMLNHHPAGLNLTAGAIVGPGGAAVSLVDVADEMERIGQSRRVRGLFAPGFRGERPHENLPFFVSGAHVAEVEGNLETGEVVVRRIVAAHDVGRVVNPQGVQGQVEGAVLMSIGGTLMEEYLPGTSTGLSDYYLPTACCTPEIEVIAVEVPSRWGPQGVKGLGEAAMLPTAPAIVNAIYRATGARLRALPATPERVLAVMRRQVM
ncbi:MAG: molybdopterin-dependent oxidoreductase [Anaerolineae bacterium]|jgi:CO/xanthine dehydrogenase Mo-binding subunit/aerobic-type carbon monoxide dehydrogenase small subunit (CoxS/CutS family)